MQAEVEYNSCEAQRDKILSYIKSQEDLELFKEYSDPGYSGGDLDRPALKELLKDIQDKKVDMVLTYKIDRLTRSSKDFYSLIEFFDKREVAYVSVTERFDTSSASGRLLRNIMLTFAQFEREMTAERTRDKLLQRAEKGMWNGGYVPPGYKREDGKLLVSKKESALVHEIFERFVLTGSLKKATDFAKEKQLQSSITGSEITINGVASILRNPVYIGKMRWGKKIYDGLHEPIISKELFEEAQSLAKEKVIKKRLYKDFLLTGLVKCSECGSSMTNTYTNKKEKRYYYYKCYKVMREGRTVCSTREVNAEKLERFLIENLSRVAQDKQYIESLTFKMLHNSSGRSGLEPTDVCSKNLVTRVSQVLINFKNKIEKAPQVEKCLLFKRIISRISFSKESLEVIVSLIDTTSPLPESRDNLLVGKVAVKKREGAVNSDAPACNTSSILLIGSSTDNLSNLSIISFILPHNLLDKSRMRF
jgi:DNA invertase Pin-like site-specific DNA recombinase